MERSTAIVNSTSGLHARPAALVVSTATSFKANIYLRKNGKTANCKSIISLLGIGVSNGDELEITAEGFDEQEAVKALKLILEKGLENQ